MFVARALVVVAALAAWMAAPASGQPQSRAEVLAAARQALAEGRPADAGSWAQQLLAGQPNDREAAEIAIAALEAGKDHLGALKFYDAFAARTKRHDAGLLAPVAISELRGIAERAGPDVRLRTEALERLARHGDVTATRELRREAEASGTGAAALADIALARLGDRAASARLGAAASDENIRDKSAVAEAIARAGAGDQVPALIQLLGDPSPITRAAAADALASMDAKAAIPSLKGLLTDEVSRVRARAALALKRQGDSSGDAIIAEMLKSPVSAIRLGALEANRAPRDNRRLSAVKEILDDPDPLNRIRAAEVAALDNPAVARSVLVTVINDPDLTARREACRVLESLPPIDVALFRRLLADAQDVVRVPAAGGILAAARAE